jgi:uncharacterized protein YbjT (DUF2867 family)
MAPCSVPSRAPTSWSTWSASWPSRGAAISRASRARAPDASQSCRRRPGSARWHSCPRGADAASPSFSAASKAQGEQAVQAAFPGAVILRPSVVFGPEDAFYNRFGQIAQLSPFMPVICGATKLQPVYVGDVADAVMAALTLPATAPRIYELGGPDIWTLHQTGRHRRLVDVPMGVAKFQASVLEKLPGKLLTNDQLLLLARDNVATPGMPGLAELGIVATPVDLVVPAYLDRYRQGGGKRPLPPGFDDKAGSGLSGPLTA